MFRRDLAGHRLIQGFTHHLTCRVCGHSAEVDGREVWDWAQRAAAQAGFTLTGHTVELAGVCPAHAEASSGFSGVPDRVHNAQPDR